MLQLLDNQKVSVAVAFVDGAGQPSQVQAGSVTWVSSSPTTATVTPASDGMSAEVVAVAPGTAQVTVSADADLSDAVKTISGSLALTVLGGQAVSVVLTPGTPVAQ